MPISVSASDFNQFEQSRLQTPRVGHAPYTERYAPGTVASALRGTGAELIRTGGGMLGVGQAATEALGFKPPKLLTGLQEAFKGAEAAVTKEEALKPIPEMVGRVPVALGKYFVNLPGAIAADVGAPYAGMRDRGEGVVPALGKSALIGGTLAGGIGVGNLLGRTISGGAAKYLGGATTSRITNVPSGLAELSITKPSGIAAQVANRAGQSALNVTLGLPVGSAYRIAEGRPFAEGWTNPWELGADALFGALLPASAKASLKKVHAPVDVTPSVVKNLQDVAKAVRPEEPVLAAPIQKAADNANQTILQEESLGEPGFGVWELYDPKIEAERINARLNGRMVDDAGNPAPPLDDSTRIFLEEKLSRVREEIGAPADGPTTKEAVKIAATDVKAENASSYLVAKLVAAGRPIDEATAVAMTQYEAVKRVAALAQKGGVDVTPAQLIDDLDIGSGTVGDILGLYLPDAVYGVGRKSKAYPEGRVYKKGLDDPISPRLAKQFKGILAAKRKGERPTLAELKQALTNQGLRGAMTQSMTVRLYQQSLGKIAKMFIGFTDDPIMGIQAGTDTVVHEMTHFIDAILQVQPGAYEQFYKSMRMNPANKSEQDSERIVKYVMAYMASGRHIPKVSPELKPHFEYIRQKLTEVYGTRGLADKWFGSPEKRVLQADASDYTAWSDYRRDKHVIERDIADLFGVPRVDRPAATFLEGESIPIGANLTAEEQAVVGLADMRFQRTTPRDEVEVRTPAFKQWFGDWEGDPGNASKVVDDAGEPLAVYHGSPQAIEGDQFRVGSGETTGARTAALGIFFTPDPRVAEFFTEGKKRNLSSADQATVNRLEAASHPHIQRLIRRQDELRDANGKYDSATFERDPQWVALNKIVHAGQREIDAIQYSVGNISKYWLNIKRPLDPDKLIASPELEAIEAAFPGITTKLYKLRTPAFEGTPGDPFKIIQHMVTQMPGDQVRAKLQELGYDGIAVNSWTDTAHMVDVQQPGGGKTQRIGRTYQYITFDNTQQKSALANVGNYDPASPSGLADLRTDPQRIRDRGRKRTPWFPHSNGKEYLMQGVGVGNAMVADAPKKMKDFLRGLPPTPGEYKKTTFAESVAKLENLSEEQLKFFEDNADIYPALSAKIVDEHAGLVKASMMEEATAAVDKRYADKEFGPVGSPEAKAALQVEYDNINAQSKLLQEKIFTRSTVSSSMGLALSKFSPQIGRMKIEDSLAKMYYSFGKDMDRFDAFYNEKYSLIEEALDLAATGDNPARLAHIMPILEPVKYREFITTFFIGNILSGVRTNRTNIFTNATWTVLKKLHKDVATWAVDYTGYKVGLNPERTVFWNHAAETYMKDAGNIKGDAVQAFKNVWNGDTADLGRYEIHGTSPFLRYAGKNRGLVNMFGRWHDIPLRFLRSMDAFNVELGASLERRQLLMRDAIMELDPSVGRPERIAAYREKKRAYDAEVQDKPMKQWSEGTKRIHEESMEFGLNCVFISKGKITSKVTQLRDALDEMEGPVGAVGSVASHLAMPFIRIPAGIAKMGMDWSFPFSMFTKHGSFEFESGRGAAQGIKSRLQSPGYMARQVEAGIITLLLYEAYQSGSLTGAPPDDRKTRETLERQGVKWWSIGVPNPTESGGTFWLPYNNSGPIGYAFGTAATGFDILKKARMTEEAETEKIAGIEVNRQNESFHAVVSNMSGFLTDNTWLRSLDVFGGLGGRYGTAETTQKRAAESILSGFVPFSSLVRDFRHLAEVHSWSGGQGLVDPTVGERLAKKRTFPISVTKESPFIKREKAARRFNVWGENITLPGGIFTDWVLPRWRYQQKEPDYIEAAILKMGYYPAPPYLQGQMVKVHGKEDPVEVPDDVYENYLIIAGKYMKDEFAKVIKTDAYKRAAKYEGKKGRTRQYDMLSRARSKGKEKADRKLQLVMMGKTKW